MANDPLKWSILHFEPCPFKWSNQTQWWPPGPLMKSSKSWSPSSKVCLKYVAVSPTVIWDQRNSTKIHRSCLFASVTKGIYCVKPIWIQREFLKDISSEALHLHGWGSCGVSFLAIFNTRFRSFSFNQKADDLAEEEQTWHGCKVCPLVKVWEFLSLWGPRTHAGF